MNRMLSRPSPALIVALIALFVALGGTAGAVITAAVPLAKVALTANNAKKLNGQTSAQIISKAASQGAAAPGPASTAAGLVAIKTSSTTIGAGAAAPFQIACDAGQKIVSGGFSSDGPIQELAESRPLNDTTWQMVLINFDDAAGHAVTLHGVCIR